MKKRITIDYHVRQTDETGKPTGLSNYHSMQPYSAILVQLKDVLSAINHEDGSTALELAEWISPDVDYGTPLDKVLAPQGVPFAAMVRGNSEGYHIRMFVISRRENTIKPLITIKYLSDKHFVYRVTQEVNEALDEGCYATIEPPPGTDMAKADAVHGAINVSHKRCPACFGQRRSDGQDCGYCGGKGNVEACFNVPIRYGSDIESEIANHLRNRIEDGNLKASDIPVRMVRYGIMNPNDFVSEMMECIEMAKEGA